MGLSLFFFSVPITILMLINPIFSQQSSPLRLLASTISFKITSDYYITNCDFLQHPQQIFWQCALFGGPNKERALWIGQLGNKGNLEKEWLIDIKELVKNDLYKIRWIDPTNGFIGLNKNYSREILKLYAASSEQENLSFRPFFTRDNGYLDNDLLVYVLENGYPHILFLENQEMVTAFDVISAKYDREYIAIEKWELSQTKKIWQTNIPPFNLDNGLRMIPAVTHLLKRGQGVFILGWVEIDDFDDSQSYEINGQTIYDPDVAELPMDPRISFFSCLSKDGKLEKTTVLPEPKLMPMIRENGMITLIGNWVEDFSQQQATISVRNIDENCQISSPQSISLSIERSYLSTGSSSYLVKAFGLSDGGMLILYVLAADYGEYENYRIAKINANRQVAWDIEVPIPPGDENFLYSGLQIDLIVPVFDSSRAYLSVVKRFELDDTVFLPKTVPQLYIISLQ